MGKRIRAQRKGSSPRYRVASHRFPGKNRMPRDKDVVCEVTELLHSPVHSAPLARIKTPDGDTTLVAATEGLEYGTGDRRAGGVLGEIDLAALLDDEEGGEEGEEGYEEGGEEGEEGDVEEP